MGKGRHVLAGEVGPGDMSPAEVVRKLSLRRLRVVARCHTQKSSYFSKKPQPTKAHWLLMRRSTPPRALQFREIGVAGWGVPAPAPLAAIDDHAKAGNSGTLSIAATAAVIKQLQPTPKLQTPLPLPHVQQLLQLLMPQL